MCQVLQVSRAGYYKWQRRLLRQDTRSDDFTVVKIKSIFNLHRRRYGARRIKNELNKEGIRISLKKVNRLMKAHNLVSLHNRKRFRVVTTNSKHKEPIAPNVVNREFVAEGPDEVWLADITYIRTKEGWLYLAVVLDLCLRKIVGFKMSDKLDTSLVLGALDQALIHRRPSKGLIFHSDRGVQYASGDFREALAKAYAVQSMSRKGDCWDNAPTESFFATLKKELIFQEKYDTRFQAKSAVFEYIEAYYNAIRQHSSLGDLSPNEFERAFKVA